MTINLSEEEDIKNRENAKFKGVASKPSFLSGSEPSGNAPPPNPPSPPINGGGIPNMPPLPGMLPPISSANGMPVGLPPPPIIISTPVVADVVSDLDRVFPLPKKSTPGFTDDSVLNYTPSEFFIKDLQIYFYQLYRAFNLRFDMWEETSINLLKILREMNANVEKNTVVMITYIEYLEKRILDALEKFKHKRSEVIRYANVDYDNIISEFRRIVGLLGLQLRDIHLRQTVDRLGSVYLQ